MEGIPRIWIRKISTLLFACHPDGICKPEDFMIKADRIIKSANLRGHAADTVVDIFRGFGDGIENLSISRTWSTRILDCWRILRNPTLIDCHKELFANMFKALDFNSDGFIQFSEYIHWWKAFDLDPSLARIQFDYMDTDYDGEISEKEFVDAGMDYFFNFTDGNTKNRFYGPLIFELTFMCNVRSRY
ncbi:unnamed protein product [Owenia fusiformis]|uniref:EF-hand domain-containing protein n=1 Tax=Owenia fusiformis TaxID=6347 RepID=A0A8S4Q412_OWEFU|nr:unnamed protein product [Owenia fusiformis]